MPQDELHDFTKELQASVNWFIARGCSVTPDGVVKYKGDVLAQLSWPSDVPIYITQALVVRVWI